MPHPRSPRWLASYCERHVQQKYSKTAGSEEDCHQKESSGSLERGSFADGQVAGRGCATLENKRLPGHTKTGLVACNIEKLLACHDIWLRSVDAVNELRRSKLDLGAESEYWLLAR